jgi:predicted RNA binding protein YcfA (HicA-like mRNA interferase family)
MKYSELKKLLRSKGCYFYRDGTNHEIWYSPITNKKFPVARHNSQEVKLPTLNDILKQSGIR